MATPPHEELALASFYVDDRLVEPQLNRISGAAEPIQVEPKVMQVLLCLAKEPGQVVTKEAFMEQVWSDTVVTDDVLARCISELRKVFGDDAREPQYIETIRKTGYRLIADVRIAEKEPAGKEEAAERTLLAGVPETGLAFSTIVRRFMHDLATWLRGKLRPSWILWTAGAVVLAVAVSSLAWWYLTPVAAPAEPLQAVPFTSFPGEELDPALSPDGEQVAFAWDGGTGEDTDIYIKQAGAETPLQVTNDPTDEKSPTWSADGRQIAFVRSYDEENAIYIVSAIGGGERKIASFGNRKVDGLVWSPDGTTLAISAQRAPHEAFSIFLLSLASSEVRRLTTPPTYNVGDTEPAFAPDGKTLAFVRGIVEQIKDIFVVAVQGGEPTRLTFDQVEITGLDWAAEGKHIVFASTRNGSSGLWQVPAAGGTPEWIASAGDGSSLHKPSVARHGGGLTYAQRSYDTNIKQLRRPGGYQRYLATNLIFSTRWDSNPNISPDGTRIAFVSKRSGNYEIWVCERDGDDPMRLTQMNGAFTSTPRWSPDGKRLAFVSRRDGQADVYVIDAEGGMPRRVTTSVADDVSPSWAQDGNWVYFASNRQGSWQIWKVSVDGMQVAQVTKHGGFSAFEAPDGKALYYAKHDAPGIWRMPLEPAVNVEPQHVVTPEEPGPDADTTQDSTQAVEPPAVPIEEEQIVASLQPYDWGNWAVTAGGIYFVDRSGSQPAIKKYSFTTGRTSHVTTIESLPQHPSFSVSPDGEWFLHTQIEQKESDILLVRDFG